PLTDPPTTHPTPRLSDFQTSPEHKRDPKGASRNGWLKRSKTQEPAVFLCAREALVIFYDLLEQSLDTSY
ncbi:MAG: hypothetical protein QNJ03_07335, partial [Dinoroseobacter sp.]|nr:hypothetical protein [Dinoroseobacter sp.]